MLNENIIEANSAATIGELLTKNNFKGIDADIELSLFVYGFAYDSENEVVIATSPMIFEALEQEMKFAIVPLYKSEIDEAFEKNKAGILAMDNTTEDKWNGMCDSFKINNIEVFNSGLNLDDLEMKMSATDVIEYLNKYEENTIIIK